MKTKIIFLIMIFSFAGLYAQQKAKLQKVDESGFIEVDEVPVLKSQLKPEYPGVAKLAGIEGTVYLKLLIDENGNVAKAKIEQGAREMLDNSALKSAKKAKFSPAMLNNKPVKVWVILPVAFKLDAEKSTGKLMKYDELGQAQAKENSGDPDFNDFISAEKMPELIDAATPLYPEIAKRAGITGQVFVKVLVDKEGMPKKAIVIKSSSEILNQASVDAAMKSKFTPAMQSGKPIAVWIVLPYKFELNDKKEESSREKTYIFMNIRTGNQKGNDYPQEAIDKKMEGEVIVRVFFDESAGQFQKAEIVKSVNELLDRSAIEYVKKQLPALLDYKAKQLKEGKAKWTEEQKFVSGSLISVSFALKDE